MQQDRSYIYFRENDDPSNRSDEQNSVIADVVRCTPPRQEHVPFTDACSPPRPDGEIECNQRESIGTPVQQCNSADADRDLASPNWKERSSPLRALWKWGSGLSNGDAADIIAEELDAMESASSSADGGGSSNKDVPSSNTPGAKPAPQRSSLSKAGLLPVRAPAPIQVQIKGRRVTWAAGVVSPRPRECRRPRRRPKLARLDQDKAKFALFSLMCPPDDGDCGSFTAARMARTTAAAATLWAHSAARLILPLLLLTLSVRSTGQSMPHLAAGDASDSEYSGPHGGTWHPNQGRLPSAAELAEAGGNPLLLVAVMGATAAVLQVGSGNKARDRIARLPRMATARRVVAGTTLCGALAAAAVAAAALSSHPNAANGSIYNADVAQHSDSGGLSALCIAAVAVAIGAAAVADMAADAVRLGIQRDWLWELLENSYISSAPWPRESEVLHGVAACEVAGFLTGGFILLYCAPVAAAFALAVLQFAALGTGQVALLLMPPRLKSTASQALPTVHPVDGSSSHLQHKQRQQQAHTSQEAGATVDVEAAYEAGSSQAPYPATHMGECTLLGGLTREPAPDALSAVEPGVQAREGGALLRLCAWADQAASPAAAAAVLIQTSLVDLGPLVLAYLILRGVPAVLVAAAAAAAVPASALGSSGAVWLSRRTGLLCCGLWAVAAVVLATWAAVGPLVVAPSFDARWLPLADALLVASLALLAAARAAFSTVVAFLMERWQEVDDAGVIGCTQRQMASVCRMVVMVVAVALASPRRLPWLMAASAIVTSVAAAVFTAFAVAEWPQTHLEETGNDDIHENPDFEDVWEGPVSQLATVSNGNSDTNETSGLITPDTR